MKRIYLQLTLLIWLIGGLCSITLASATNLADKTRNAIGVGRTGADMLPRDTFPKAVEKKPDLDKHVDKDGSKGQAESKVEAAEAHEAEEEDGGRDKDHPGEAAAFEKEITMDPATGTVPRIRLIKAMEATFNAKRSYPDVMGNRSALSWTERGPYTDVVGPSNGNTRANNAITAGRIRALMVDSADATKKTVWVGGVDGGLWKTTDITTSPANWVLVNDFLSNLAVTAICQDPTNYNTMYFCTGEAYFNADAVEGVGVFKSTDHGVTWTHLSSTANFKYCTRILCDYQGNVYLATRGSGLRRSTDGGSTWSADLTPTGLPGDICDLEISNTGVPGRLHLVTGIFSAQGYRYTDVPATVSSAVGWTSPATGFPSYSMRAEIAVSGNTLYAAPANAFYNVPTIYKSTDGGANWAAVGAQPASGGWASGQGWYNLSVAINPSNPNQCIVGGLDNYKTTDGGASWTKISSWVGLTGQYVHADQHNLAWLADGNTLIFACDGGIHYSSDGGTTIRDRNVGLRLKQFYSIAIHPTSTNYFLAGAQDNGTHKLTEPGLSSSVEVTGGDGAFVAIDQNEASYQFGAYIRSNYRRSVDGGATWTYHDFSNTGRFINPFDYDNAANKLYAAYDAGRYFRWNDPQTGSNSTIVSVPEFNSSQVSTVSVSPYTANRVYFGTGGGRIVKVDNADGATPTAVNLTQAGMPTSYVSCIATGTNDQNLMTVYSNYGVSNIWVSTNGGTSWTACEGNLPDMPVRWCLFYPGDNTKAYIATETGVWETTLLNGASTVWVANPTFPTVRATMLKYRDSDKTLVASTHGRGVWSAQIAPPCVEPGAPTAVSASPTTVCSGTSTNLTATSAGNTIYWYTVSSGGMNIGTSASGANFNVTPDSTTTYYAEAYAAPGCVSPTRTSVTVTVTLSRVYVNKDATGANNGRSWTDAFTTLQPALESTCAAGAEIWVAKGTYFPTKDASGNASPADPRTKTFVMKNLVGIYGGFLGSESLLGERNWSINETILSGDIGISNDSTDNCYHVVYNNNNGLNSTAVLDGLTVTRGNSNSSFPNSRGGGLFLRLTQPSIRNCKIQRNSSNQDGGAGAYISNGNPTFGNCIFDQNTAPNFGGAVQTISCSPVFDSCSFTNNSSPRGGCYLQAGAPQFKNCTFERNYSSQGGAIEFHVGSTASITNSNFIANGGEYGGSISVQGSSLPIFANCRFSGNNASIAGGAIYNWASSKTTLVNCTFSGQNNAAITNDGAIGVIKNSIFWGNTASIINVSGGSDTVSYSNIQVASGVYPGVGNTNLNPLFVVQPPIAQGSSGNLRLQACSPSIDAGLDANNSSSTDLDGNARAFDAVLGGQLVDMGAYEFQNTAPMPAAVCKDVTVYLGASGTVTVLGSQINDGSSTNCGAMLLINGQSSISHNCSQLGVVTDTLKVVMTENGRFATCTSVVTVVDTVKPTAKCKNVSVLLNSAGIGSTNATAVNDGSTDNCTISSLSLSKTTFNCTNVGANTVFLSVTDNSNNTGTCTATVTVGYTSAPVAKCRNAIVLLSTAGNGTITPAGINNGSTDLCASGLTFSLSKTTFNCSNVGANVVTLTVTNVAGNSSTCTGTVTVKDQTKPVAKCQAVTIDVPAGTTVTVPAAAVNNGSSDGCTNPPSLSLLPNQFTCANVGPNTVTLTATDASNNKGTCTAIVTVTCSGGSINIQNGSAAAVANLSELMDLMPNPATDQVIVRLNDDALVDRRISVVDYTGKQVFSRVVPAGDRQLSIDLSASDFSTGVYMVSVQFKGSVQTKQLVVFR